MNSVNEKDDVMSKYYDDNTVTALISFKADIKKIDDFSKNLAKFENVRDIFIVTGDSDIIIKTKFASHKELKEFVINDVSKLDGYKDSQTMMVVTTYKEKGTILEGDRNARIQ